MSGLSLLSPSLSSATFSVSGPLGLSHICSPRRLSSLTLRHALPTRITSTPHYYYYPPTSLSAFDTRNRLVVLGRQYCRQLRQTAHRSHALSLVAYSPTGSPTGLSRSPVLSSLSLCLYLYLLSSRSLPLLTLSLSLLLCLSSVRPFLYSSLRYPIRTTTPYAVSRRGYGASQLNGARQLRNNNNAVRRCVASRGVRHRNAIP